MSDGYDYPDADTIPPVKPQSKPHALSREQVEVRLRNLDEAEALVLLAHDADQHQALAQQAQEVERLEGVCLDRLKSGQRLADENILLRQSLAAMTTERDDWKRKAELLADDPDTRQCCDLRVQAEQQLAASQQKGGELEEIINKADYRHIMDQPDGGDPTVAEKAQYLVDRMAHADTQLATLQATLAAREARIEELESDDYYLLWLEAKDREFADHNYQCLLAEEREHAKALKERDAAVQDAGRLKEALSGCVASLSVYVNGGNPASPYKNGANPCYVLGSREALDQAQRALKGAHD